MTPPPPLTALADLQPQLASAGFAVLDAASLSRWTGASQAELQDLAGFWSDLPPDAHLRDGGRYRRRRHSCFVVEGAKEAGEAHQANQANHAQVAQVPHRAHWQPVEYNALHGGFERWFEPMAPAMAKAPAFLAMLEALAGCASALRPGVHRWYCEAHPFRIDCTDGIGRPTPEGAHRDGVDLVAVVLVARHNVKGAETRVFDARGPQGMRFTLTESWSVLLLDDERVIHESTPIQPLDPAQPAWRDTLVLTLRQSGFQGPQA